MRGLFNRKCVMHDTQKHSTQIVEMTDMVYADLCSPLVILYIFYLLGGCKYNMTLYWLMIEPSASGFVMITNKKMYIFKKGQSRTLISTKLFLAAVLFTVLTKKKPWEFNSN